MCGKPGQVQKNKEDEKQVFSNEINTGLSQQEQQMDNLDLNRSFQSDNSMETHNERILVDAGEKVDLSPFKTDKKAMPFDKLIEKNVRSTEQLINYHTIIKNKLSEYRSQKEIDDIVSVLVTLLNMFEKPMAARDEAEAKRMLSVYAFYMDNIMGKCNDYMVTKVPRKKWEKIVYTNVKDLFLSSSALNIMLNSRVKMLEELEGSVFNQFNEGITYGDFLKKQPIVDMEQYSRLRKVDEKGVITFNSGNEYNLSDGKLVLKTHISGMCIAKSLGLDHGMLDYRRAIVKTDEDGYVNGNIKPLNQEDTLGKLKEQDKMMVLSKKAFSQLFELQLMDILVGRKNRNIDDLRVVVKKKEEGEDNGNVYIESFCSNEEPISFSTDTEMDIENFEVNNISTQLVEKLRAMRENPAFLDSLELSDELRAAFETRLNRLVEKIDKTINTDAYKQKLEYIRNSSVIAEHKWECKNSYLEQLGDAIFPELADRDVLYNTVGLRVNQRDMSRSQLSSGVTARQDLKKSDKPSYGRMLWSKIFHIGATVIGLPWHGLKYAVYGIGRYFAGKEKFKQEKIITNRIPGKLSTDEDRFAVEEIKKNVESGKENQDVLDDTRMLPLAYEEIIPVEEDEPPYISIKIQQPKEGSSQSEYKGDMGHSMIEIEYSRLDKKTNKKRRYRSRFGFYPKGGFGKFIAAGEGANGLMVPGVILNDNDHKYNVGRRFKATNQQINKMILFANDYAQSGGYNFVTRNCSTFAVEALKHAGVGPELHMDRIDPNGIETAGLVVDTVLPISIPIAMCSNYRAKRRGNKDDLSYQRSGQKMFTKEEYKRLFVNHHDSYVGYTPAFLGEALRDHEQKENDDENFDLVQSYEYKMKTGNLIEELNNIRREKTAFISHLKKTYKDEIEPEKIEEISGNLDLYMTELDVKRIKKYKREYKNLGDAIEDYTAARDTAEVLSKMRKYISKVYNITLKRDRRVDIEIHHFASTIEMLFEDCIHINSNIAVDAMMNDRHDHLVKAAFVDEYDVIDVARNKKEPIFSLTLPKMVAYAEIFGNLEGGLKNARRMDELLDKKVYYANLLLKEDLTDEEKKYIKKYRKNEGLTKEESAELSRLSRNEDLADTFQKAHMHYFESDTVDKQLADIAFSKLPKLEKNLLFSNDLTENNFVLRQRFNGPAELYQHAAFDKIFAGKMPSAKELDVDHIEVFAAKFDSVAEGVLIEREKEFNMILEAIYQSNPGLNDAEFCNKVEECIVNSYLRIYLAFEYDKKIIQDNPVYENSYFSDMFRVSGAKLANIRRFALNFHNGK